MAKILLVDDDDIFRLAFQRTLTMLGHEVIVAEHGQKGLSLLAKANVDLVISDIRMPVMDGLEFLKSVRATSKIPIILVTGFSEIVETHQAHELGANEFLTKPIDRSDLEKAIHRALASTKISLDDEAHFCRLAVEDFMSGRQINFNVFIRLGERRFVKIAHKGEDLSLERVRSYREKKVHYFYLRRSDFREYLGFSLSVTQAARKNKGVSPDKKLNLLRHTGTVLVEQIARDGLDEYMFYGAKTFVHSAIDVLADHPDIYALLDALNNHTDYLYAHSVGTSLYSVLIAQKVGWTLPTNKFKVAMGGLLHDVGQKELELMLLQKPRRSWNVDEVKQYESHAVRGLTILSEIDSIPTDVLEIAKQHHENCAAQGFPARLRKNAIHPMAKLVSVANEFCHRVVKNPHVPLQSPREALIQMGSNSMEELDATFLQALIDLFRVNTPNWPRR